MEKLSISRITSLKRKISEQSSSVFVSRTLEEAPIPEACNSTQFRTYSDFFIKTPENLVCFTKKSIISWVHFMNECGFPCYFRNTKGHFTIELKRKDYFNNLLWNCAITAIRYPVYGRQFYFADIAEKAVELYLNTETTAHEALCEAHNIISKNKNIAYFDYGHALNDLIEPFKKEQLFENVKKYLTVNQVYGRK